MFLNPYFWGALVLSWIVVAVSVYEHEETEFNKERAIAQAALDAANKHSEEITNERNAKIADISSRLADTQAKAVKSAQALNANLASGAVRLSIAGSCGSQVSNDSTPTSIDNAGTCNIDPRAAQALVALTERGDGAIEKLNACIDSYNVNLRTENDTQPTSPKSD